MGALWTVHWSDAEGRICFGQLIDVTNQNPPASPTLSPAAFFLSGPHWGRAVFQSEAAQSKRERHYNMNRKEKR